MITNTSDLYSLDTDTLMNLERMGRKSSGNLISSIEASKNISFARFIYAQGIKDVGLATSNSLAGNFSTLDDLINTDTDQLTNIQDIGPVVAESILMFLENEKNRENIELLIKAGINIEYQTKRDSQILKNKIFVLTGSLASMTRSDAQRMIEDNGGKVTSSISQNTSYLVAGENPGSKIKKASNIGVNIISEDQLVNLINDG